MKKMKRNENNQVLFDYCKSRYFDLYSVVDFDDLSSFDYKFEWLAKNAYKKPKNLYDVYNSYSFRKEKAFENCKNEYFKLIDDLGINKYTNIFIISFNIFQFTLGAYFIYNNAIYKIYYNKAKSQIIQLSEVSF